jgi:sodium-dependent dicarboxylate transporter 2/3/5
VLLVGAGLVLGNLMSNTGLAEIIGTGVVDLLGFHSVVPVVVASVAISIFISEATSNTAAVGVVVPVVIPIAVAAGIDPTLPAVAAVFGASMGFMMPVSTPPNAIVYGSGMVPIFRMFRTGLVFDIIAVAVISAGVLAVAAINPLS